MKKPSASDAIQDLIKGKGKPAVKSLHPNDLGEKLVKRNLDEPREKKQKGTHGGKRANTGGARPNSGPDPLAPEDQRRSRKAAWREFGDEEVDVVLKERTDTGTVVERRVKLKRLRVIQNMIYEKAVGVTVKGDMEAAKEFNNRVLGKSPQPLVGDDDEPPIQVDLIGERLLEKAYGNEDDDE